MALTEKRMLYLDVLRGGAIALVLLLHCLTPFIIDAGLFGTLSWKICVVLNEFCRAGVPLFFMISGYLLLSGPPISSIGQFYRRKLPRLVIPLLGWNVVYYVFYRTMYGEVLDIPQMLGQMVDKGTSYHMWFIYTLIGIYLIAPFLKKITDNSTTKELLILLAVVLFPVAIRPLINTFTSTYLNLFDPLMEGYLGYFMLGYVLGKVSLPPRWTRLVILGGALGAILGIGGNFYAHGKGMDLVFNWGYVINHFLLAAGIFCLVKCYGGAAASKLVGWVQKISALSFSVFWVHVLILTWIEENLIFDYSPIGVIGIRYLLVLSVSLLFAVVGSKVLGLIKRQVKGGQLAP